MCFTQKINTLKSGPSTGIPKKVTPNKYDPPPDLLTPLRS